MTTIVPQSPTPPPVPNAGSQVTITVQNPPPALTQLPTGAVIDAEVLASSSKGIVELNSVFGKLAIKTALPLPENAKLDLQILRTAPQLQLMIKALNNTPLQLPSSAAKLDNAIKTALESPLKTTVQTPHSPRPSPQGTTNTSSTPIKLDIGAQIKATLLRPIGNNVQPPSAAQPTVQSQLPAQTQSATQINEGTTKAKIPNALGKAAQAALNMAGKIQAGTPNLGSAAEQTQDKAAAKGAANSPRLSAAALKAGTQFGLKFVGAGTTTTVVTTAPTPRSNSAAPTVINGTVVATTPSGQPIINTPLGMMAIDTKVPLLPGQSLRLEVIPSQIQIPTATSAESRFESMFISREWPNLTDAIREIGQAAPAVSQQLVSSTLPQPNTQLTSNTLFFLNALKGGDMKSWMGSAAASLLDQINPELLGKLDEDFVQLGRAVTEPQSNEWRTALVPFFNGMGLEQFQMHTQGQFQEGKDAKKVEGSRFIIDVALTRLGRLQLDGFVRAKGKRLDLIVRTDGSLPKQMRNDISKIYVDFSEAAGVVGQISFQADKKFVEISMPQLTDHPNKGIVI